MKLHLGCWHRIIPNFIHVDYCDYPHIDFKSNIADLPFIKDNSVDLIYCSHAFEYFDRDEAIVALKEWNRVLKTNGILRLAVPNFDSLVALYNETGDLNRLLGPLYGKIQVKDNTSVKTLYHKTVYNFSSLAKILYDNNFYHVKVYDWRNTEHSHIDDHSQSYYPHMDKENGRLLSLNVEAYKL